MKKIILSLTLVSMLAIDGMAQDPGFTQYYANPLYLNPAFAGSVMCPRVCLNYRNQWPALSGTFVTYSASYDQHVESVKGGLGFLMTHDRAGEGTINTTNLSGIYAYQIPLTRKLSIRAGFQATFAQKSLDWNKLTFGDQINTTTWDGFTLPTSEVQGRNVANNLDISSGILLYSTKIFAGFAAHHLTQPDESLMKGGSRLPIKYTAHAGAMLPIGGRGTDTYVSPNIIYMQQQDFTHLNLGFYVLKGPIVGGLWYRAGDAMIALVGFQQGIYKFGYSYDITLSKLGNVSAGSHELSCSVQFKCKPVKKRFTVGNCPSF